MGTSQVLIRRRRPRLAEITTDQASRVGPRRTNCGRACVACPTWLNEGLAVLFEGRNFLNFPNDGKRHEIIDGEHYVAPSPNTKHQRACTNLTSLLWACLKQHPIGEVFTAPFDVVFSDIDVVEPDLLYISRERREVLTGQHVRARRIWSSRSSRPAHGRWTRSPSASCTNAPAWPSTGSSIPSSKP